MPRARKPKDRMIPRRPGAHAYAPPKDEEAAARWRASTFKPGQSGNPGGTPKPVKLIRDKIAELTRDGEDILKFFDERMKDRAEDGRVRVACAEWLGAHYFGKPKQTIEVEPKLPSDAPTPVQIDALLSVLDDRDRSDLERILINWELAKREGRLALPAATEPIDATEN